MRILILLCLVVAGGLAASAPVMAQTPERAVIAGTLIEDRDNDGALSVQDGGAQTLVTLMGRDRQGGYYCADAVLTGEDGKFQFDDLLISEYDVMVWWAPGFLDYPDAADPLTLTVPEAEVGDGIETLFLRLKPRPEGMLPYPVPDGESTSLRVPCEGPQAPVTPGNRCTATGLPVVLGAGQTLMFGRVSVQFPDQGRYTTWSSTQDSSFVVCYVEGNSWISFSLATGLELQRHVDGPFTQAAAVFSFITDSVRVLNDDGSVSTPSPRPGRAGGVVSPPAGGSVKPPSTGSAGLASP